MRMYAKKIWVVILIPKIFFLQCYSILYETTINSLGNVIPMVTRFNQFFNTVFKMVVRLVEGGI